MTSYNARWLFRSTTKKAVFKSLTKPMTPKEIFKSAMTEVPKIHLRHVYNYLDYLVTNGLIEALTKNNRQKIYCMSALGRQVAYELFGMTVAPPSEDINWELFNIVTLSERRTAILLTMHKKRQAGPRAIADIKRYLQESLPGAWYTRYSPFYWLAEQGLIMSVGRNIQTGNKMYILTEEGEIIARELLKYVAGNRLQRLGMFQG